MPKDQIERLQLLRKYQGVQFPDYVLNILVMNALEATFHFRLTSGSIRSNHDLDHVYPDRLLLSFDHEWRYFSQIGARTNVPSMLKGIRTLSVCDYRPIR
jgi:hypothetical protein